MTPEEYAAALKAQAKRGLIAAIMSTRPDLVIEMRRDVPGGRVTNVSDLMETFDLMARAAELHGEAVGSRSFEEACHALLDDYERRNAAARDRVAKAMRRDRATLPSPRAPFDDPDSAAFKRAAPTRGPKGAPVPDAGRVVSGGRR